MAVVILAAQSVLMGDVGLGLGLIWLTRAKGCGIRCVCVNIARGDGCLGDGLGGCHGGQRQARKNTPLTCL